MAEPYYPSAPSAVVRGTNFVDFVNFSKLYTGAVGGYFLTILYSTVHTHKHTLRYGLGLGCMRVTTSSNCKLYWRHAKNRFYLEVYVLNTP